jgi:hypothetical protein
LFRRGFTWFKDWYFPEGFMEGDQKLQAEKPIDEHASQRHRARWVREINVFIERAGPNPGEQRIIADALHRAGILKETLK